MRIRPTVRWTGGLLLVALAICWLGATFYPDQLFSVYLEARRWVEAVGPIQHLPGPVAMRRENISCSGEREPKPYVVLPLTAAAGTIGGRPWQPTELHIGALDASLPLVPQLRAKNWFPEYDLRINHPEQYFRQYFPVIQRGKKLIYVNAFYDEAPYWHQRLVRVMDGGPCYWQALYDPEANAFLMLTINGVA